MLFWIAIAVAVVVYGVIAFLSARNWQVGHVILLFAVSIFAFGALLLGAMVLKTHREWRTVYDMGNEQLTKMQAEIEQLERGSAISPSVDFRDIPTLTAELSRVLIDRGRVWRGVTPAQVAEGTITLSMQGWGDQLCARAGIDQEEAPTELPAEGDAPAPQPSTPHGVEKGAILFAFAEIFPKEDRIPALYGDSELPQRDTKQACRLPGFYLGRFLVSDANEQAIQLTPVYPLSETQLEFLRQQVTWALYESMPEDQHDIFAGRTMEQLQIIFPQPPGVDPAEWQSRLTEFVRDGQPAEAGDPDERKWVQIRFLQDTTVDVDAADDAVSFERPFDATGRATQRELRQGSPTEFKKGDVIGLSLPAANVLIRNGSAELTEEPPVYRRQLRDYAMILQSLQVDINSEAQLATVLAGDRASIATAIQEARDQSAARQQEQQRLEADLANFQVEQKVIGQVANQLQAEREAQRRELSRLYQSNQGLRNSLTDGRLRSVRTVAQSEEKAPSLSSSLSRN